MGINRSGYYKWKSRQGKLNRYEQDRILLTQLLHEEHELHPSLGYHRLARNIFHNTGWVFSDNLAHKCCKAAGIRSKARKCRYRPPGEESIKNENLVKGHWKPEPERNGSAKRLSLTRVRSYIREMEARCRPRIAIPFSTGCAAPFQGRLFADRRGNLPMRYGRGETAA